MADFEEIVEMAVNRTAPMMIAYQLKCDPGTVYNAIRRARKEGVDIPAFGKGRTIKDEGKILPRAYQIVLPIRLHSLLVSEAEKRGFTAQEMGQRIIEDGLLAKAMRNHV